LDEVYVAFPAFLERACVTRRFPFVRTQQKGHVSCCATLGQTVCHFLQNEAGSTAVESAVTLAPITVVSIIAIAILGANTNRAFTNDGGTLGSASRSDQAPRKACRTTRPTLDRDVRAGTGTMPPLHSPLRNSVKERQRSTPRVGCYLYELHR
jgi:Flp pilus assembly pilin Flp